jgi:hypothetical protein
LDRTTQQGTTTDAAAANAAACRQLLDLVRTHPQVCQIRFPPPPHHPRLTLGRRRSMHNRTINTANNSDDCGEDGNESDAVGADPFPCADDGADGGAAAAAAAGRCTCRPGSRGGWYPLAFAVVIAARAATPSASSCCSAATTVATTAAIAATATQTANTIVPTAAVSIADPSHSDGVASVLQQLLQAVYSAYPEAIGCVMDTDVNNNNKHRKGDGSLPLHLAVSAAIAAAATTTTTTCSNPDATGAAASAAAAAVATVKFVLSKFPDAARRTNHMQELPLHLAVQNTAVGCGGGRVEIVRSLLAAYPAAVHMADQRGYTPLHRACELVRPGSTEPASSRASSASSSSLAASACEQIQIVRAMVRIPLAVSAVTAGLQKPLHVAAEMCAPRAVLACILERDPGQARCTDENFHTPLHKAVLSYWNDDDDDNSQGYEPRTACGEKTHSSLENIQLLVTAFPGAAYMTDMDDERPYDVAVRLFPTHTRLQELLRVEE